MTRRGSLVRSNSVADAVACWIIPPVAAGPVVLGQVASGGELAVRCRPPTKWVPVRVAVPGQVFGLVSSDSSGFTLFNTASCSCRRWFPRWSDTCAIARIE